MKGEYFTQKEVAEIFGLKQQAISNYIRGIRGHMKYLSERITQYIINERDKVKPIDITMLFAEACDDILRSRVVCEVLYDELICTICKQQPINCPYKI